MNIKLSKVKEADLETIMNWRMMPEVSQYMYTDPEIDLKKQHEWFERIQRNSTRKDWVIDLDGEKVGVVSLTKINKINQHCEWAYYLASPNVRGKGVGKSIELSILKYVFEELGLNKLLCEVFVSNELVIKIHEKYGSKVEGTRRQHIFKNNAFHDIVEMGIIKSDWIDNVKGKFEYTQVEIED